jgi:hypothetical protein
MNKESFGEALMEAQRFVALCQHLAETITDTTGDWDWPISGTKETGSVRRASMDLSRALSRLRRCN